MTDEIWKSVKGYEGIYEVSNMGRIMSLNWRGSKYPKLMTPIIDRKGYYNIVLSKNGKTQRCLFHRIVAEAFIEDIEGCYEINHKDEDKGNNKVSNLEWCTRKYNMNYGTIKPRMARRRKENKTIDRPTNE